MHEIALCQSIFEIADRARAGRRVEVVRLRIGRLRQVVPETLEYCWTLVSESTGLAGSRLAIEHLPVVLRCSDCGRSTVVGADLVMVCADCGNARVEVVSGEEFVLTSLEVADDTADLEGQREVRHG